MPLIAMTVQHRCGKPPLISERRMTRKEMAAAGIEDIGWGRKEKGMEATGTRVRRKWKNADAKIWSGLAGLPPDSEVTVRGLASALGVVMRTIWRMIDRCELPQPIRLGKKQYWKVVRLTEWFDRMAERLEKETERRRNQIDDLA